MSKHVVLTGEVPYIDSLSELARSKGYHAEVYYVDELDDQETLDRLVNSASQCDVFIESLNESTASKLWLIEGVEANLRPNTPLLTNALCANATEVASWCANPRRVIGFGMIPPIKTPGMVEFVPALQADLPSATLAREFFERMGLEAVRVPDTPGLVRARMICSLINEAVFALDQKIASAEDIDTAMRLSCSMPQGPLAWADEIGLDVVLGTLMGMYEFWGEERYRPAPLLKQKVRARHLGKKTGRGFYVDPLLAPTEI